MDRRKFLAHIGLGILTIHTTSFLESCRIVPSILKSKKTALPNPFVGVTAHPGADPKMMQQAGITLIRHQFPFPFADKIQGELQSQYLAAKAQAESWKSAGLEIMGVTPLLGWGGVNAWYSPLPAWFGIPGTTSYLQNYQQTCSWLAKDLRGIVCAWQIANEVDNPFFAAPLNLREACDLVMHGARGLKSVDIELFVGTNSTGIPQSYYLFGRLYNEQQAVQLDYCGLDEYYGTWHPGRPEQWSKFIAEIHDITLKPIVVNEWGFTSRGGLFTEEERAKGLSPCQVQKWMHTWGGGHSPETQAEYIRVSFNAFSKQQDKLRGVIYYRWEDQETCELCGSSQCPIGTAWGLVDTAGRPKPAYYAFKQSALRFVQGVNRG